MGFQVQTQGSLPAINAALLHGAKMSTDKVVHRILRDALTHMARRRGERVNARYTKRA